MKALKLSWVLILVALGLALNGPNLRASESPSQVLRRNNSTLSKQVNEPPSARVKEENEAKQESDKTKPSPDALPELPVIVNKPASDTEKGHATNKSQQTFTDGFTPPTWPSWVQVAIAALGLFFIWRTLKAVERQSEANFIAAEAARSANDIATATVKITQRSRIIVSFREETMIIGEKPKVVLGIHNVGLTPAYIVQSEVWGAIIKYPFEDFTPDSKIEEIKGTTIYPGGIQESLVDLELPQSLTPESFGQIERGEKHFCFRILIKYRDEFGDDRYTDYGIGISKNRRPWPMSGYSTSN